MHGEGESQPTRRQHATKGFYFIDQSGVRSNEFGKAYSIEKPEFCVVARVLALRYEERWGPGHGCTGCLPAEILLRMALGLGHIGRTAPILVLAGAAPLLLLLRPDFVEPLAAWLFVATIWVALIPAFLFVRAPESSPVPLMPLAGAFYIVFFALPPFIVERHWWTESAVGEELYGISFEAIRADTAGLVFAGVTALFAAYGGATLLMRSRLPRLRLPTELSLPRLRLLLWMLVVVHIAFLYSPAARTITSLAQAMAPVGLFAVGMLFVTAQRGHLSDVEKVAFWVVVVPLETFVHVYEGLITPIILLFVFLITLYWYVSHRAGIVLLLALCASLYIFPVLKLSNFFIVENSPTVAARVSDKMGAIGLAAQLFSSAEVPHTIAQKNVAQPLLRRLSLVVLLQYCVDQTPERIAYLQGETLKNLLTNLVPRVFWPNKPTEVLGQWFGHKYRILRPDDKSTSINLPWLVEFYVNFGPVGVLLGMASVGVLLAALEQVLLRPEMSDIEAIAGWALLFRLFYQESNLSLMLGGVVTQAALFLGFLYVALQLCRSPQTGRVES